MLALLYNICLKICQWCGTRVMQALRVHIDTETKTYNETKALGKFEPVAFNSRTVG